MKTKLLLLFTVLSMGAYAQGNLQFNQVLTFNEDTSQTNIYTVPTGKVAKITKAIEFRYGPSNYAMISINGKTSIANTSNSTGYWTTQKDGMWLKPGDSIGTEVTSGALYPYESIMVSIIEYNIISP